jgi:Cdc6-like AAA superfamily ATPase
MFWRLVSVSCSILYRTLIDSERVETNLHEIRSDIGDVAIRQKRDQMKNWLSAPDPSTNYKKALQQRQQGTGTWLLHSTEFTRWNTRQNSLLWLYGIPGCGKTILSSTAIQHLETRSSQHLLYFYFDFSDNRKQNLEDMVMSLVSQLYIRSERAQKPLDALFVSCNGGRSQPSSQSLCKTLTQMIEQASEVWVVLDALDECRTRAGSETQGLLKWIAAFLNSNQRNVHLLATSRPEQDISSGLSEIAPKGEAMVSIQSDLVRDDIETYVNAKVRHGDGLKRWRNRPDVQDEIVSRLITKANGM